MELETPEVFIRWKFKDFSLSTPRFALFRPARNSHRTAGRKTILNFPRKRRAKNYPNFHHAHKHTQSWALKRRPTTTNCTPANCWRWYNQRNWVNFEFYGLFFIISASFQRALKIAHAIVVVADSSGLQFKTALNGRVFSFVLISFSPLHCQFYNLSRSVSGDSPRNNIMGINIVAAHRHKKDEIEKQYQRNEHNFLTAVALNEFGGGSVPGLFSIASKVV